MLKKQNHIFKFTGYRNWQQKDLECVLKSELEQGDVRKSFLKYIHFKQHVPKPVSTQFHRRI